MLVIAELRREAIDFIPRSLADVRAALVSSAGLFFSTLCINVYTVTNIIIVGLALGPEAAGAFALAERVRTSVMGIYGPVSQALYPFLCRVAGTELSYQERRAQIIFFRAILFVAFGISVGLYCGAPCIVNFLGGTQFSESVSVLRVMAATPVIIALSNILGIQTMLANRMERQLNQVLAVAGGLGLTLTYPFARGFGVVGAASSFLLIECFVTLAFAILVGRRMSLKSLFVIMQNKGPR